MIPSETLAKEMREWLHSCDWMESLAQARNRRLDDTGLWLADLAEYRNWLQNVSALADDAASRFLIMRGMSESLIVDQCYFCGLTMHRQTWIRENCPLF
jgi:hypothetical protein